MAVRVLLALRRAGIREAVLNLAHGADAVPAALGTGEALGMRLFYSREGSTAEEALETRGGLVRAMDGACRRPRHDENRCITFH